MIDRLRMIRTECIISIFYLIIVHYATSVQSNMKSVMWSSNDYYISNNLMMTKSLKMKQDFQQLSNRTLIERHSITIIREHIPPSE